MKKEIAIFAIIFTTNVLFSQGLIEEMTDSPVLHVHEIDGYHNDDDYKPTKFNYNTYQQVNTDEFHLKYPLVDLEKYTFFIVFSYDETKSIVNITSDDNLLQLTPTMVKSRREIPVSLDADYANVLMYSGSSGKKIKEDLKSEFRVGSRVELEGVGSVYVAEIIVLDRILPRDEAKKYQSMLAVKYGVSLPQDSSYVDSYGEKVFDPTLHFGYDHHVVALAKDGDLKVSQTTNTRSDFFQIGVDELIPVSKNTLTDVSDGSYLFISDNDENLSFTNQLLDRRWKLSGDLEAFKKKGFCFKLDNTQIEDFDNAFDYALEFSLDKNFKIGKTISYPLTNVSDFLLANDLKLPFEFEDHWYVTVRKIDKNPSTSTDIDLFVNSITSASMPVRLTITTDEKIKNGYIDIYTASGYRVLHETVSNFTSLDQSYSLSEVGAYFLTFRSDDYYQIRKIVVQ